MEGVPEDMKLLYAKFKHDDKQLSRQEQQLNLKRRWLMGLTMSSKEEKRLKASVFRSDRVIPELLLREDDTIDQMDQYIFPGVTQIFVGLKR